MDVLPNQRVWFVGCPDELSGIVDGWIDDDKILVAVQPEAMKASKITFRGRECLTPKGLDRRLYVFTPEELRGITNGGQKRKSSKNSR